MALVAVLLAIWLYAQSTSLLHDEIVFSYDVSSKNAIQSNRMPLLALQSTSSDDESISQGRLVSLVETLRTDGPQLVTVIPAGENSVFYIAHDFELSSLVMLRILADDGVIVNGDEHTKPFRLSPGAHGFQVVPQDGQILVQHVYAPVQSH